MTTPVPPPAGRRTLSIGRLEALSDGVFAIAITLLVLELSVPDGAGDRLWRAVSEEWPSYLAYVVSFAAIGGTWLGHSVITQHLHRADTVFVRLNLLLLLLVSLLPFPTGLVAQFIGDDPGRRVASTIFGVNLLLVSSTVSAMWRYAVSRSLVHPDTHDEQVRILTDRFTPGLAGYVVFIGVGIALPLVAVFGYLVIALAVLLPIRLARTPGGGARHAARRRRRIT